MSPGVPYVSVDTEWLLPLKGRAAHVSIQPASMSIDTCMLVVIEVRTGSTRDWSIHRPARSRPCGQKNSPLDYAGCFLVAEHARKTRC
jgi:hypothetical protein